MYTYYSDATVLTWYRKEFVSTGRQIMSFVIYSWSKKIFPRTVNTIIIIKKKQNAHAPAKKS